MMYKSANQKTVFLHLHYLHRYGLVRVEGGGAGGGRRHAGQPAGRGALPSGGAARRRRGAVSRLATRCTHLPHSFKAAGFN